MPHWRPWALHLLSSWSTSECSKRISMQQGAHLFVSPTSPLIMSPANTGFSLIYLDTHIAYPVSKPWLASCALFPISGNRAASPGCCVAVTSHRINTERFCLMSFRAKLSSTHSSFRAKRILFQTAVSSNIPQLCLCLKWSHMVRAEEGPRKPRKFPK